MHAQVSRRLLRGTRAFPIFDPFIGTSSPHCFTAEQKRPFANPPEPHVVNTLRKYAIKVEKWRASSVRARHSLTPEDVKRIITGFQDLKWIIIKDIQDKGQLLQFCFSQAPMDQSVLELLDTIDKDTKSARPNWTTNQRKILKSAMMNILTEPPFSLSMSRTIFALFVASIAVYIVIMVRP